MDDLRNKRVTVAGLGRFGGGIAVTRWLVAQGAQVLVTDLSSADQLTDSIKQLEDLDVQFALGGHRAEDFTAADLVVTSPAVKPTSAFIAAAREAGVPVTTEIRLFLERCPAKVIAVTGTKGKSTTTAMLGRILESSLPHRKVWVGGNIGKSLLGDLGAILADDLVVLELSSFMLEYLAPMQWSPHVAVVTMLAVDHVDWHGSERSYLEAKKNIVRFQREEDFAVLGRDVPHADSFAASTKAQIVWFSTSARRFDLLVPGEHNQFNAHAAYTAASLFGVTWEQAQHALTRFTGLPHRLQLVHEEAGVRFYNDSIATIPQAAVAALEAFEPRTVIQIVGGYDKGLAFDGMARALDKRAKAILCIGKTADKIANLIPSDTDRVQICGDLASAMRRAKQIASQGDVVLLSTGCASYDQFANFEQRGETFAKLAAKQ
ncbi:MAG TPA: UDP-N-acetylmuramoyl-L-alanine--D-glutamate ligase [Tepidisphaeraceae bacterium]|jgi:UDP-N-acetylmuramoylalanine--D-glutamate ligase